MRKGSHFSKESLARVREANHRTHSGEKNHNYKRDFSPTTRAKMSIARKGKKLPFETRIKMATAHRGNKNYNWKGWRRDLRGYVSIQEPTHPFCNVAGYVYEHRLVMDRHLGRTLLPEEVVHHINAIKDDNRIENLMLFSSNKEHSQKHAQLGREKNGSR